MKKIRIPAVLNLPRSPGLVPLPNDEVSKPLLEKLIGWLLEKSMGSVCSSFELFERSVVDEPALFVVLRLVVPDVGTGL